MSTFKPVLRWPGAKWSIAEWIVEHLPPHEVYVEPFFGSGAVFFSKIPSPKETINDLDGGIVNLFRVLREQPEALTRAMTLTPYARQELEFAEQVGCSCGGNLERARCWLVQHWMRTGYHTGGWRTSKKCFSAAPAVWNTVPERIAAAAIRLKDAQIECRPALDILGRYRDRDVLIYADPPYMPETRDSELYNCDMTAEDHVELLNALLRHPGPVLLSGYESDLYGEALAEWTRLEKEARTLQAKAKREILWLNDRATGGLSQQNLF